MINLIISLSQVNISSLSSRWTLLESKLHLCTIKLQRRNLYENINRLMQHSWNIQPLSKYIAGNCAGISFSRLLGRLRWETRGSVACVLYSWGQRYMNESLDLPLELGTCLNSYVHQTWEILQSGSIRGLAHLSMSFQKVNRKQLVSKAGRN